MSLKDKLLENGLRPINQSRIEANGSDSSSEYLKSKLLELETEQLLPEEKVDQRLKLVAVAEAMKESSLLWEVGEKTRENLGNLQVMLREKYGSNYRIQLARDWGYLVEED